MVIETVAAEYLAPLKEAGVDTLVLGCTHYPLLEKVIGAYMGPEVRLINSGAEGARAAADCLRERDALAGPGRGSCRCFVGRRTSLAWPPPSWAGMWPRRWSRWISANIEGKALYI